MKINLTNGLEKWVAQGWVVLLFFPLWFLGIPFAILWVLLQNSHIRASLSFLKRQEEFSQHMEEAKKHLIEETAAAQKQIEEQETGMRDRVIRKSVIALQDQYDAVMEKRNAAESERDEIIKYAVAEGRKTLDLAEQKSNEILESSKKQADEMIVSAGLEADRIIEAAKLKADEEAKIQHDLMIRNANAHAINVSRKAAMKLEQAEAKWDEANKKAYFYQETARIESEKFLQDFREGWLKTNLHSPDILNFLEQEAEDIVLKIDAMENGIEFEHFFAEMLEKSGYDNVEVTKASGDMGSDVLAEREGIRYSIQCKRYKNRVDIPAVQQAASGRDYYKCNIAVVVTNNTYTKNAQELAQRLSVVLWDRDFLKKLAFQYCRRMYILEKELDARNY